MLNDRFTGITIINPVISDECAKVCLRGVMGSHMGGGQEHFEGELGVEESREVDEHRNRQGEEICGVGWWGASSRCSARRRLSRTSSGRRLAAT